MSKTKIEWTEHNFNWLRGCSRKSTGCENCYAETIAGRFSGIDSNGKTLPYTNVVNERGHWNGNIEFIEEKLLEPLRRKTPTKYFVNSMSDTFHENVKDEWLDKFFAVAALCPQHIFQVLTKRAYYMGQYFWSESRNCPKIRDWAQSIAPVLNRIESVWDEMHNNLFKFDDNSKALPNVWLGVSVENQKTADERIPYLLETPAAVRWLSVEPLLEGIDLTKFINQGFFPIQRVSAFGDADLSPMKSFIDWVVVGGESGHNARPVHPDWVRSLRDQCVGAGVPFFFKQWGGVNKKKSGRILDGRTWDDFPQEKL